MGFTPDIMTCAKGITSGYIPLGASIVSDEIFNTLDAADEFAHGYTYAGHPVACAVALENLRLLDEDGIIERAGSEIAPYLKEKWESLTDHPLVGEAKIVGLMGSIALTPNKATRAKFASSTGTVGYYCRERCFANNLVMRHVGDRMIISPPLIITKAEIDILIDRARLSLDETLAYLNAEGLNVSA